MKPGVMHSAEVENCFGSFLSRLLCHSSFVLPYSRKAARVALPGTITDSNGGAIAGATVTVTDMDQSTPRTLTTDDSGAYNAPNLLARQI